MSAWDGWVADVLGGISAPVNAQTGRFVNAWGQCEQSGADFNPLNTTQPEPGATNYNSAGVKNYPDQETGLRATIATLTNGYYNGIVADLRAGTYTAAQIVQRNSSELATWGTRVSCVAGQLGTSVSAPSQTPSAPRAKPKVTQAPPGPQGPVGAPNKHLTKAWDELAKASTVVLPHRAGAADRASRRFRAIVSRPTRRH